MDKPIPRSVDEMFPSRFLKPIDLGDRALIITIERISVEETRPNPNAPSENKYVLWARNASKGIILNKTMASQIATAVGSPLIADWFGKQVVIYTEMVRAPGGQKLGIRFRPTEQHQPDE